MGCCHAVTRVFWVVARVYYAVVREFWVMAMVYVIVRVWVVDGVLPCSY